MVEIAIDTSDLPHPEPFTTMMEALRDLKPHCYIKMTHRMEPLKLYEACEKLGYSFFTQKVQEGLFNIYVCKNIDQEELKNTLKSISLKEPKDYTNASCVECRTLERNALA